MIPNITYRIFDYFEQANFTGDPSQPAPDLDTWIDNGKKAMFSFKFPWYASDNTGLNEFQDIFVRQYMYDNIRFETWQMFIMKLQGTLMKEMPEFEQLYQSTLIKYDPLINRSYTEEREDTREDTIKNANDSTTTDTNDRTYTEDSSAHESSNSTNNNQNIHSDNPQTNFAGNDYASAMDRGQTVIGTTNDGSANANSSTNDNRNIKLEEERNIKENRTDTGLLKHDGFVGADKTDNILKFRSAILNLNKDLVNRCDWLFMAYLGGGITDVL